MKKLLILAYDFPPYVSVGGLRPYNWFRYLKEFGVEPIVVTRQWQNLHGNYLDYITAGYSENIVVKKFENGIEICTPYKPNMSNRLLLKFGEQKYRFVRKAISGFFELAQFLYPIGPKSEIYIAAREYLKQNKVDAIIATGDPFVLFKYASELSKEFGIPWIADYRDPWSHNQEYKKYKLQKWWNAYHEKKTVKSAAHIVTVSRFVYTKIESLIPEKEHSILPNGFDPEVIEQIKNIPQGSEELNIGFVGTIYDWHPIDSFLRTIEFFVKNNPKSKLMLNFYGTNIQKKLDELVHKEYPGLKDHCNITAKMPNSEVIKELARNNVVLLFNYYSYMGTKIFDYLGIQRKMILCYSNDPEAIALKKKYYRIQELETESNQLQADLINETNSGIIVKDQAHLLNVLEDLWKEFSETGQIACNSHGVEKYSRKVQVERLASLLGTFRHSSEHSK